MQNNEKKNIFMLILIFIFINIILVFSGHTVYSVLPHWTGSGTETDPYLISNAEGLIDLANEVNGGNNYADTYFALVSDIDLISVPNWTPIGGGYNATSPIPFSGNFNGRYHTISNMTIVSVETSVNTYYFGLFGYIRNARIHNLLIQSPNYIFSNYDNDSTINIGNIVGYDNGGSVIYNCGVSNGYMDMSEIKKSKLTVKVGGIIGHLSNNSYVINSFNNASIVYHNGNRKTNYFGGICGFNDGQIYNCFNTSSIRTTSSDQIDKSSQDPISGNHKKDYPNYYDLDKYGTLDRQDISIPYTTEFMQSEEFADILDQNIENLPPDLPVEPEDLNLWQNLPNEYPVPELPSETINYYINYSSLLGINIDGEIKTEILNEILPDNLPVTMDRVEISPAFTGLLSENVPASGSGKLAIALRYNDLNVFITDGMPVTAIISSYDPAPQISFLYYADSRLTALLNEELITVRLKSINTATNIITYYLFNIKVTTEQITAHGQAFYDRGRHYGGLADSTTNPVQADSCFTVQFLTVYNPSKMGNADSRRIILSASAAFPANTRFTLVDKTDSENPKYYYYMNSTATDSIDLTEFITMGALGSSRYQVPDYDETKTENLIIVIDYSTTDNNAVASEIYLRHTINDSDTDMLTDIPKVQSYFGYDAPTIELTSADSTINSGEALELQVIVTAAYTKTIYNEQRYSVVLRSSTAFPYNATVEATGTIPFASGVITDSNKTIILPVEREGIYNIRIEPSEYGYWDDFVITAGLYSAPDASYPYTTSDPIATDLKSVFVQKGNYAIKANISDKQRLIEEGSKADLNFTIQTIDTDNINKVRITVSKKNSDIGFNYTMTAIPVVIDITSNSITWEYESGEDWEKGIYKFTFELLDSSGNIVKSDSKNIICYD